MADLTKLLSDLENHLHNATIEGIPQGWCASLVSEAGTADRVSSAEAADPLALLQSEVSSCVQCRLCETRKNTVFGEGNTRRPRIAFVGEGPGADEDRSGRPFVGRAGQLLTKAITHGIKVPREEVYICNTVKCRPPGNRNPLPDELESCRPYFERQIELIQPQVLVALGSVAFKALTHSTRGIMKSRGQWHEWNGIPLMPTVHPAYILRNPASKRLFWEDLQAVMKRVGY